METDAWVTKRLDTLGLNQEEFGHLVGSTSADISRYRHQKATPHIENIERLASGFRVDVISLLVVLGGIDPDDSSTFMNLSGRPKLQRLLMRRAPSEGRKLTTNQGVMWFHQRLGFLGLTQSQVAQTAGFQAADLSRYKFRKASPRVETVARIATGFSVDVLTVLIALGAIDPDAPTSPRLVAGKKNSESIWMMS